MPQNNEGGIEVFLRIRPPYFSKTNFIEDGSHYSTEHTFHDSLITFHVNKNIKNGIVNNSVEDYNFKFNRVFEHQCNQEDVFSSVARPLVLAALDGYNSTIFAYGETGSGKTYSITGGTDSYQDRGIIPRALSLIYEEIKARSDYEWTIKISYLQIYNDKGQDLLNRGHDANKLEDLPLVSIHEQDDEVILKGLEEKLSPTLHDALELLFLGDTNRLYCETRMNKTSSRSHCIFSIHIESRLPGSATVRRSKFNLVDLAGSERVYKTGAEGNLLSEAKYINLSLHFLEHVIVALSEQAKGQREHVPFRNSFMTMCLRDSLGSNCRTAMLATSHSTPEFFSETISTCKFAQRVACIQQSAHINEETDPLVLARKLKAEVAQLREQLAFYIHMKEGGVGEVRVLTSDEYEKCKEAVLRYVDNTDQEATIGGIEGDWTRILTYFGIMKNMINVAINGAKGGARELIRTMMLTKEGGSGWEGGGVGNGGIRRLSISHNNNNVSQCLHEGEDGGISINTPTALIDWTTQEKKIKQKVDALTIGIQQRENEITMLFNLIEESTAPKFNAQTQTGSHYDESDEGNFNNRNYMDRKSFNEPEMTSSRSGIIMGNATSLLAAALDGTNKNKNNNYNITEKNKNNLLGGGNVDYKDDDENSRESKTITSLNRNVNGGTLLMSLAEREQRQEQLQQYSLNDDIKGAMNIKNETEEFTNVDVEDEELAILARTDLLKNRQAAFEAFRRSYRKYDQIEKNKQELKTLYDNCKRLAAEVNACVDRIKTIKKQIQQCRTARALDGIEDPSEEEQVFMAELDSIKQQYIAKGKELGSEKEHVDQLHLIMRRAQEQVTKSFEEWFAVRLKQLKLAQHEQYLKVLKLKTLNHSSGIKYLSDSINSNHGIGCQPITETGGQILPICKNNSHYGAPAWGSPIGGRESSFSKQSRNCADNNLCIVNSSCFSSFPATGGVASAPHGGNGNCNGRVNSLSPSSAASATVALKANNFIAVSAANLNNNNTCSSSFSGKIELPGLANCSSAAAVHPFLSPLPTVWGAANGGVGGTGMDAASVNCQKKFINGSRVNSNGHNTEFSINSDMDTLANSTRASYSNCGLLMYNGGNGGLNMSVASETSEGIRTPLGRVCGVGEGGGVRGPSRSMNPFAPRNHSTGDLAADRQLAEMYKARDVLRARLQQ